jgi:phosphohistidine phosphatase
MEGTGRLIVMRHAQAGELPGGPDIERALTPQGRDDSAAAGAWLRDGGYRPDQVICSAARRARQTWQHVSEVLGGAPALATEQRVYRADAAELAEIIREAPEDVRTLMVVGHNPAIGQLAAGLTGTELAFPAAAIAVIEVAGGWAELSLAAKELHASWTPAGGGRPG